jgi:hypothetical protein
MRRFTWERRDSSACTSRSLPEHSSNLVVRLHLFLRSTWHRWSSRDVRAMSREKGLETGAMWSWAPCVSPSIFATTLSVFKVEGGEEGWEMTRQRVLQGASWLHKQNLRFMRLFKLVKVNLVTFLTHEVSGLFKVLFPATSTEHL